MIFFIFLLNCEGFTQSTFLDDFLGQYTWTFDYAPKCSPFFSLFCFQPIFWQMAFLIGWCKENGNFIRKKNIYREQNLDTFLFLIKIPNQNRKPVSKVLLFRPTYQQTLQFRTQKYQYYLVFWCFWDNFVQMVKFIAFRVQTMAPLWLGHNFSWLYCPSTWINGNFSV